jgi:PAS domain S-box-containing protein
MPRAPFTIDFQHLFETLPGLYVVLDPSLKVLAVTDEYLRATMVEREELMGRYLFDVFPDNPDAGGSRGAAAVRASLEKVFATGEPDELPVIKYDVQRPRSAGGGFAEKYWRLVTFPGFDANGRVAYIVHRVEDITERKITEDVLRESEMRLKFTLAAGQLGSYEYYPASGKLFASEKCLANFGLEPDADFSLETFFSMIDEIDRERVRQAIENAVACRTDYKVEFRIRRGDGKPGWIYASGRCLYDENGSPLVMNSVTLDITDRRQSEENLRESQQRLALALQAGRAGTFEWDIRTGVNIWSPELEALYGLPAGTFEGDFEAWKKRVVREDAEAVSEAVRSALERGDEHFEFEFRAVLPDGSIRWFAGRARFEYDVEGRPLRMIGINIDITDRKLIEENLSESDERFHLVTQATNDVIWDRNLQTGEVWWNDSLKTAFGFTDREIEPTVEWWYAHIHPEDRDRVISGIDRAVERGEKNWTSEYRFICADGGFRYVLDRGFAVYRDGKPVRMLGAVQDVTERRKAEEALRLSQDRLELAIEASSLGLWYCDLPFDVLDWSELTKNHFWLEPDAVVTIDDFYALLHPDDREKTRQAIDRSLAERSIYDVVYRTVNPADGRVKWVRAIGRGFYDEKGAPYRFDGVTIDITETKLIESEREQLLWSEKTARAEAERANRMKDEFLATLSHELRTPLSSILGWSRLLREGKIDDGHKRRAVETIERNAKAQAQLIEDILDVSRITSGKLRLDVRPVDLSAVIEMAIESVGPAAEAKNIRLTKIIDTSAIVSGDPDRLQQVVWNLLSNAIKFTGKGGDVQIRLERAAGHVEISVADNGIGIDAETLPYVFERFRQSDSSTTRKYGGLGLGLAIVRHLVELHGGTVSARSDGPDKGAVFIVTLPVAAPDSAGSAFEKETETARVYQPGSDLAIECPKEIRHLRILLVDDEPDTRTMLEYIFTKCGAAVKSAASVDEALETIGNETFDVLISDIGMPERDGYELIRQIRSLAPEKGGRIPAVALTAYARVEDRLRILSSGFQMHVPKPVEPAELLTVVASLAERRNHH